MWEHYTETKKIKFYKDGVNDTEESKILSLRCIFHKRFTSFYDTIKFEHLKLRLDNISLTDYPKWIFTTYSQ